MDSVFQFRLTFVSELADREQAAAAEDTLINVAEALGFLHEESHIDQLGPKSEFVLED